MFKKLVESLIARNLTIATVESITGGMFASKLTDIPGVSSTFRGSLVTYSNDLKIKLASVDSHIIYEYGAVSSQVAIAMAKGGKKELQADIVVAFTGNAGPATLENEPVGSIYVTTLFKNEMITEHLQLSGSRQEIREQTCIQTAEQILKLLN